MVHAVDTRGQEIGARDEDLSELAQSFHTREGLRELQAEALPLLLTAVLAAALLLFEFSFEAYEPRSWFPSIALAIVFLVVLRLRDRHILASTLLVAGMITAVSALIWLFPGSLAAVFFVLVVFAAGVLLGPREGFVTAAASSPVLLYAALMSGVMSKEMLLVSASLVWGAAVLSWLSTRPLYIALDWSWSSYVEALKLTKELRLRQGELVRLSRGLEEAYRRLERLNADLAQARQDAEEARRLKAEFAATISHELRTPLNLVVGFSELMVVKPLDSYGEPLPEVYRGDIEAIYLSACHISNLIDDVLDLSQIEAHRMALHKELVSPYAVVAEATATVRSLFADKRLSLSTELSPDLPEVWLDRGRIRQILINLPANAARFTKRGGATVRANVSGHDLVLSVADTGVGIRPEDLPDVFKEFYQLGSQPELARRSSGLGLAISRRFAEMHGGRMWVESIVGEGSTFFLSLPLADAAPMLPPKLRAPGLSGSLTTSPPTVVVVAESEQSFGVFQRYLDGYHLVRAENLPTARSLVLDDRKHAVLLAEEPNSGIWSEPYVRQLETELGARVPVIWCPLRTTFDLGRELGVSDYLVKPVTREQLSSSIARLPKAPHRVLVIDDEPHMARLLARLVRSLAKGRRVLYAHNGAEGLRLIRQKKPDLVLLDLLMPEMTGYEVLEAMRSDNEMKDIAVMIVSAKGYGEETITASEVRVRRLGGLSVGEAVYCVKSSLDAVVSGLAPIASASPADAPQ